MAESSVKHHEQQKRSQNAIYSKWIKSDKININRQMYPTLSINFRLSTVLTFAGIDKLSLSDRAKINCHEYVCTV